MYYDSQLYYSVLCHIILLLLLYIIRFGPSGSVALLVVGDDSVAPISRGPALKDRLSLSLYIYIYIVLYYIIL